MADEINILTFQIGHLHIQIAIGLVFLRLCYFVIVIILLSLSLHQQISGISHREVCNNNPLVA